MISKFCGFFDWPTKIPRYSRVPSKHVGWNKHVERTILVKLVNMQVGIIMYVGDIVVRIMPIHKFGWKVQNIDLH